MPATILLGTAGGSGLNGGGSLKFQNVLTNGTLVATSGFGPTLSITRATASTTIDGPDGLVKPILSGEARFWKLRRVENKLASPDFSGANWLVQNSATVTAGATDPLGGTTAYQLDMATAGVFPGASRLFDANTVSAVVGETMVPSFWIKGDSAGTITLSEASGGFLPDTTISVTTGWQRLSFGNLTATGTTIRVGIGRKTGDLARVYLWRGQLEKTTGQAITAPSEYVSKGVLSSPYYGAGIDGVRYFNTANGNTVASNVVTEATGASLTLTAAGLSVFGASTERLLQNRDLTNAAWTKGATATVAKDQTGVDGVANSASSFTGGAVTATNTVTQAFVLASSARYQYAWIKRLVGTGTIEMTTDGGISWVNVTSQISSSWALVTIPVQTLANPSGGLRITTNGDKIAVDFMSNRSEAGAPVVATVGSQVTVNADVVTASGAGVINQTEGTLYVRSIGSADTTNEKMAFTINDGTSSNFSAVGSSGTDPFLQVASGGVGSANMDLGTFSAGVVGKVAGRYRLNDFAGCFNAGTVGTDVSGAVPVSTTTFAIGNRAGTSSPYNGVIQEVRYYNRGFSDTELASLTA